jgi:alcohol dehydrogenase
MTAFAAARSPRHIIFGAGQRHALTRYVLEHGHRALVCTDSRMATDPMFVEMIDSLKSAGVDAHVYDRTEPELPVASIHECVRAVRSFSPDVVVGIGGGSCLDLAKAVALLLTHGGSLQDYYGEFKFRGPILPVIAVPTTAGTGSEVTPVAVMGDPEKVIKVGIASPELVPHTAICDPELTLTCPPGLTAIAGADALTHAIEALTAAPRSNAREVTHDHVFVGKNGLSDEYARIAISRLGRSLAAAVRDGQDEKARDDVMFGALMAGLAFGTAGTAAAHALQYPIGAVTHTAHGAGVACLLPYVMEYNCSAAPTAMADVALAMGARADQSEAALAAAAIETVAELFGVIGIAPNLKELGLPAEKLDWCAEQSLGAARLIKNNPRPLDIKAMTQIVQAAFCGQRAELRAA